MKFWGKQKNKTVVANEVEQVPKTDYKELYKITKKELENQQKKVANEKRKEQNDAKLVENLRKELALKKEEAYNFSTSLKEAESQINNWEKKWEQENQTNKKLEEEMTRLRIEKKKLSDVINGFKGAKHAAFHKKSEAEGKLKSLSGLFKMQKKELKQRDQLINQKNRQINELKRKANSASLDMNDIPKLLNHLTERLTSKTFNKYGNLTQLIKKHRKIKGYFAVGENSNHIEEESLEYGYITKKDADLPDNFYFTTINQEEYRIVPPENLAHKIGKAVSAAINKEEKTAYIVWSYDTPDEMLDDNRKEKVKKRVEKKEETEKEYPFIGPISVLLVTSKNGVKFRDQLAKCGVKATWVDPHERNHDQIRNIAKSQDVVILFENAMRHSTRQLIEEFKDIPDKVQTMFDPDEKDVIGRVRYVALKLGKTTIPIETN